MNPEDPIADSIDFDLSEGLTDPSRAAAIMRILPQLVGAQGDYRQIGGYSGLPQTGGQALADVAAGAGQLPSGIGQDVRMPNLGKMYADRAQLEQRGDIASNELENRRVMLEDAMTRARANQGMNALDFVQKDRQLAQQMEINKRLLAQDARMRIEFIANAAKAAGAQDSPEYRAYMDHFMRALRDPTRLAALTSPQTGVDAMTAIMNEALQASRSPQAATPRAETTVRTVEGVSRPQNFPTVAPTEQRMRDQVRDQLLADERAGTTQYSPAMSEPQKPVYPPAPVRTPGMGDAAYQKAVSEHAKIVSDMNKDYQQELARFDDNNRKAAEDAAKREKESIAMQEQAVDAKRVRDAAVSNLSETLNTARSFASSKGLSRIVGPYVRDTVTGDARDALTLYENVVGSQIVQMLGALKEQSKTGATGFGALSERELDLVKAAASKLSDRSQSEAQFRKHLNEYITRLQKMISGVEENYSSGPWAKREGKPSGVRVTVE